MGHHIFLSYARADEERVAPYVAHLEGRGYAVWVDNSRLDGATIWSAEIAEAIEQSTAVLVMCSAPSMASSNVRRELTLAAEGAKTIIPVYLEPVEMPPALRYYLAGVQHIEAFEHEEAENVDAILRSLSRATEPQASAVRRPADTKDPAGVKHGFIAELTALPREAQLSLAFAAIGLPAWFALLVVYTVGVSFWEQAALPLSFLFAVGFVFNLTGIVMAYRAMRHGVDAASALWVGLITNVGEAIAVIVFLILAWRQSG